jgi:hypothetical protein
MEAPATAQAMSPRLPQQLPVPRAAAVAAGGGGVRNSVDSRAGFQVTYADVC